MKKIPKKGATHVPAHHERGERKKTLLSQTRKEEAYDQVAGPDPRRVFRTTQQSKRTQRRELGNYINVKMCGSTFELERMNRGVRLQPTKKPSRFF
jgi:hypothetical protein